MRVRAIICAAAAGLAVVGAGVGLGGGVASAVDLAMDPAARAVRGSCSESYLDIFAAARTVQFSGDYARMAVRVAATRDPETGVVVDAHPEVTSATDNLSEEARAVVLEGVRKAYLRPEPNDCKGVVAGRKDWVLRFGDKHALAAPDDPVMINRATASTRLRNRSGAVELVDPLTARTRLTRVPAPPKALKPTPRRGASILICGGISGRCRPRA